MSKRKKTILITGGAGFMGSNYIRFFLKKNPQVFLVNLDKLTYAGNLDNTKDFEKNRQYTFVKGDIAEGSLVDGLFKKYVFAEVVNFAAETHVDRSILGPRAFFQTDVIGVLNLLETVRRHGISKFVQVSTDEVYGEARHFSFTEKSPFNPRSPYSASKAGGDHLVLAYFYTYGVPVVRVHSCNFYGPYQHPEKFIPLFITNLLEGKKVPLYGQGNQVREWIYTNDFCTALELVRTKGSIGDVYNIGTGQRMKNRDIAKILIRMLQSSNTQIVQVKDRPGHDVRYAINSSKMKQLGFKPAYSLKQGLELTISWYKENEWWWKKIKNKVSFKKYYKKQYDGFLDK